MTTATTNPFVQAELSTVLTAQDVADILRLKVWTVNDLARRGEIPSFRVGKARRFLRSAVEDYIRAQVAEGRS
jgi:putative molybdopterin biosynthesis protein